MSDDLISRKALIEEISSLRMYITGLRAGKGVLSKYMEEYRKSVIKCIEEAPTAYDVDTVCNEIHEVFKEELDAIFEKADGEVIAEKIDWILKMNKKINEIARNGGKK